MDTDTQHHLVLKQSNRAFFTPSICHNCNKALVLRKFLFTSRADVAAASIKLLAGAVTLLLLPARQNVHVHWPRRKVLNHHRLIGAVVLVGPVDASCVPVCPIDELTEHGHGKRVDGRADDDLPTGPCEGGSLNLLSESRAKPRR